MEQGWPRRAASPPARPSRRWLLARGGGLVGLGLLTGCGAGGLGAVAPVVPAATSEVRPPLMPATPSPAPGPSPSPARTTAPPTTAAPAATTAPATPVGPTRWAVIGDFGEAGPGAAAVATLVKSWQPAFVITTGDNNYVYGAAETIDRNIGQYYQEFIHPYRGQYGAGATRNRFFPSLGNHDWDSGSPKPYLDYFTLPGNGRYYSFTWGPVRFFALSSDRREPDGVTSDSVQARWLQREAATARPRWQIAYMHHPPFSSGRWGSNRWMQWPYPEWGIDMVLAGHDHTYERLRVGATTYIVNGLGGAARYPRHLPAVGSQAFFNAEHGALLVEADAEQLSLQFVTIHGEVIDRYQLGGRR